MAESNPTEITDSFRELIDQNPDRFYNATVYLNSNSGGTDSNFTVNRNRLEDFVRDTESKIVNQGIGLLMVVKMKGKNINTLLETGFAAAIIYDDGSEKYLGTGKDTIFEYELLKQTSNQYLP